jgi:hypothetical protein
MSRSIHQTIKNVFYKKSKREINEMCDLNNTDIDAIELRKKHTIKKEVRETRRLDKLVKLERNEKGQHSREKDDDVGCLYE